MSDPEIVSCSYLLSFVNVVEGISCNKKDFIFDDNICENLASHLYRTHGSLIAVNLVWTRKVDFIKQKKLKSIEAANFILDKVYKSRNPTPLVEDPTPLIEDHTYHIPSIFNEVPLEFKFVPSCCGDFASANCSKVTRKIQMVVNYNNSKVFEYGRCIWQPTTLEVFDIVQRLERLPDKRKNNYKFYAKSLIQSDKAFLQTAIDAHYTNLFVKDPKVLGQIKSKGLKARIQKVFDFGNLECPGTYLPELARSLQQNCRKSVLDIFGPFLNMYKSKISIEGSKSEQFFFVDPVPLCLMNLHHPEMLALVKKFKRTNTDAPFLITPAFSDRSNMRIGSTVEDIYKEHLKRTENEIAYRGSVPLLLRMFQDGALVSNWSNRSVSPILVGVENLHPDLQTSIAAKTLTGYYPSVTINSGWKTSGALIRQQYWHGFNGDLINVIETYHRMGGIVIDVPGEYLDGKMMKIKFFPYICAFGK